MPPPIVPLQSSHLAFWFYEKQEPSFLRKLRGEHGSDRHNVAIARPSKSRLDTGDDDGPTMVDEAGGDVSKEEYEAMIKGEERKDTKEEQATTEAEGVAGVEEKNSGKEDTKAADDGDREKQKVAQIGGTKRRKQGMQKIVCKTKEKAREINLQCEMLAANRKRRRSNCHSTSQRCDMQRLYKSSAQDNDGGSFLAW